MDDQWAHMSRKQKERALAHNEFGRDKCGRAWANLE